MARGLDINETVDRWGGTVTLLSPDSQLGAILFEKPKLPTCVLAGTLSRDAIDVRNPSPDCRRSWITPAKFQFNRSSGPVRVSICKVRLESTLTIEIIDSGRDIVVFWLGPQRQRPRVATSDNIRL